MIQYIIECTTPTLYTTHTHTHARTPSLTFNKIKLFLTFSLCSAFVFVLTQVSKFITLHNIARLLLFFEMVEIGIGMTYRYDMVRNVYVDTHLYASELRDAFHCFWLHMCACVFLVFVRVQCAHKPQPFHTNIECNLQCSFILPSCKLYRRTSCNQRPLINVTRNVIVCK